MDKLNHHSESKALQKRFSEDRDKLIEEFFKLEIRLLATKTLQVFNQRLSLPAAQIFTKLKNWAIQASRISSKKYLLPINGQCST